MSCQKHLLGLRWERHAWRRLVVGAEELARPATDQWGRSVVQAHTLCHIEYRCARCGAVRDGGDCGCDKVRGDACPARLAWVERQGAG